ncbi:hypothetical protein SUDANB106_00160 [Streptomyces sp. enrichment culture]|uniref:DUF6461 domain-containing protein n=1 Tax=Streptomyces sp. enrichment culture TaxID=1795815 RepID=UPI003F55462C
MSRATARDYRWLEEHFPELAEAYCLTAIRGLAVSAVLARLDAVRVCAVRGVDALYGPAYAAWDAFCGERLFAGVTAVDGWTLMVEPVGFLGVTRSVAEPLSRGTTVVSHSRTIEAVDRFRWYQDGVERLSFEPLFPYRRGGSTPEVAVEQMRVAGFDLRAGTERDIGLPTQAAFALAERLTGVQVTRELLETAPFTGTLVGLPHP